MKQLCLPTPSYHHIQEHYKNFEVTEGEMNDRWDYLLADLSDEVRSTDQRYPRHHQQNDQRERGWPTNSNYMMDIFNQHPPDLSATSSGFPAFITPSISTTSSAPTTSNKELYHNPLAPQFSQVGGQVGQVGQVTQVKTEPTSYQASAAPTVRFNGHGNSLNMDDQEQKKLERKRARNRAAASKCRQRKLERIQELEGQVQQERQRNAQLQSAIERTQQELQQLRQSLEEHRQAGCPIGNGFN